MNVLFSSAGRRVELMECFRADSRELGISLTVFASDAKPALSPACQVADRGFTVPRCHDPEYIPALLELCQRERVNLLVPTIDTELEFLARSKKDFLSVGTLVAVSDPETVAICRDKFRTAEALQTQQVEVPRTLSLEEFYTDQTRIKFPVILKPKAGSSSVGILKVSTREEMPPTQRNLSNYIVQELRSGPEYTVNLFFDEAHQLRSAVPHLRLETRGGEVSKGITERNSLLTETARKVAQALHQPFGALCFQAILSPDPLVFEINARFGGGFPLAHHAGAKFSKWLLESAAGKPSSITPEWKTGVMMLRYDSSIFLES